MHYTAAGAPGKGKSTLLNSLFNHPVLPPNRSRYSQQQQKIEFAEHRSEVVEAGVRVGVEVVEVLGFGEIGQSKDRAAIIEHVEQRHRRQFEREQAREVRKRGEPSRLFHAALVFLSATNHGINHSELELIKELQKRTSVIPIVSKADTLMPHEYEALKVQIRDVLKREGVVDFPPVVDINDEEWVLREAQEIRARFPLFTTAGYTHIKDDEAGKPVRLREYPWGTVNLERDDWNDLFYAQRLIVRSFFEFLRVHTEQVIYEQFRSELIVRSQQTELPLSPKSDTTIPIAKITTANNSTLSTPTESEQAGAAEGGNRSDADLDAKKKGKKGKKSSSSSKRLANAQGDEIVFELPVVQQQ